MIIVYFSRCVSNSLPILFDRVKILTFTPLDKNSHVYVMLTCLLLRKNMILVIITSYLTG